MGKTPTPKRGHTLPHGAGSFYYAQGRGRWVGTIEAGWTNTGKRRRITITDTDENRAWQKLQTKRKQILNDGIPTQGTGGTMSVAAWAAQYVDIRRASLKPKPWASEKSAVTRWIIPTIGHKRLTELTAADMRTLGDAVTTTNSSTHAGYVQRIFQQYLRAAIAEGYKVPAHVLEAKRLSARVSPRAALSMGQAINVLKAAHEQADHSRWDAAFLQGLRQGEALGLTWDQIDFQRGTLAIRWTLQELTRDAAGGGFAVPDKYRARQLDGRFWLLEPKSRAGTRMLPLVPQFRESLLAWREVAPKSPHGLVWPRANGMPRLAAKDRVEFAGLQARGGVSKPGGGLFTVHEARHAVVSLLLELGVAREVIEAIVGHSQLVESYVHVGDGRVAGALDQLGRALGLGGGVA